MIEIDTTNNSSKLRRWVEERRSGSSLQSKTPSQNVFGLQGTPHFWSFLIILMKKERRAEEDKLEKTRREG
jgi:hypothetical protein